MRYFLPHSRSYNWKKEHISQDGAHWITEGPTGTDETVRIRALSTDWTVRTALHVMQDFTYYINIEKFIVHITPLYVCTSALPVLQRYRTTLYSGSLRFESWHGNQEPWLRLDVVFFSPVKINFSIISQIRLL